ncbi:MAG: IS1634 family transposase [Acidimicrobiales bacterium]
MSYLVGKKQGGKTYYYLTESARVNGKPRIVSQTYLGSAEEIAQRLSEAGPGEPGRTQHLAFGNVAATWGVLERLGAIDIVDEVVGSRRSDAALSVGTYIALAALNRVVAPCSKLAFSDWWAKTAGDRLLVRAPVAALDHRRFWDAMDAITAEQLIEIERRIVAKMLTEFAVDVSGLVLDMTNFATYIDSSNDRAPIAQRGKAKQKRNDLRLVGLGLVVSVDGGIPLVSHAYAGNRHDSTQFSDVVGELVTRFGALDQGGAGLTVVFDAGQDSENNLALIDTSPLHFIGSLPPSDHLDLMAVPTSRYKKVDAKAFPGVSAFESTKVVFGRERRIVVTHSQSFHDEQTASFEQTLSKARRQLSELAARLARGKGRKSREKVEAEIAGIVRPRWLSRVISTTLVGTTPSELRLSWRTKPAAKTALADELFGKRIIFTDRNQWSVAEVVAGYRSQSEVEADFRQMKDRLVVSFSPMFHWTEQKIHVHVFYCVLALMVARLMARETERAKMPMSVRVLLSELGGIEETVLLYQGERGRPRARRMLTEMEPMQARLYDLFGLDAYAPTR